MNKFIVGPNLAIKQLYYNVNCSLKNVMFHFHYFLGNIYDNFIDMINFNDTFENDLIEWIKDTLTQNNKNEKIIL